MGAEILMIESVLSNWRLTITRLSSLFDNLSEPKFLEEIAPGRNRVIYILGHLTAVHDLTLEILGLARRHYPQLDDVFIKESRSRSRNQRFGIRSPVLLESCQSKA
jgi:hypothetical protein